MLPLAQPQQIVIPTSGGGAQMIVNGGAVQPFVMQQVMQIQDPQTGQIQTGILPFLFRTRGQSFLYLISFLVIAHQPQQQYMIQTVTDPNTNSR